MVSCFLDHFSYITCTVASFSISFICITLYLTCRVTSLSVIFLVESITDSKDKGTIIKFPPKNQRNHGKDFLLLILLISSVSEALFSCMYLMNLFCFLIMFISSLDPNVVHDIPLLLLTSQPPVSIHVYLCLTFRIYPCLPSPFVRFFSFGPHCRYF